MHTTITIPRAAVIDDLGRLTHYTSAKAPADALQRADDTLLATWFRQAAAQASTALRHLLAAYTGTPSPGKPHPCVGAGNHDKAIH